MSESPDSKFGREGFQYVVLRCVPRADREEFINVGVVLYCQQRDFLDCAAAMDAARMRAFAPSLDLAAVTGALESFESVCRGTAAAGAAAQLAAGPRFGWLSAPRSTVVRPGPIHGGVTSDPAAELARLLVAEVG